MRFKDEKATLTDQLSAKTQELESAEQSFKNQMLDMQKKIDESSTTQLNKQAAGSSAVNDQLEAVRLEAKAAIEAGKRDSEVTVKNLTAQLNAKEELLKKQIKVLLIAVHYTYEYHSNHRIICPFEIVRNIWRPVLSQQLL
jgi:hypothetical protein